MQVLKLKCNCMVELFRSGDLTMSGVPSTWKITNCGVRVEVTFTYNKFIHYRKYFLNLKDDMDAVSPIFFLPKLPEPLPIILRSSKLTGGCLYIFVKTCLLLFLSLFFWIQFKVDSFMKAKHLLDLQAHCKFLLLFLNYYFLLLQVYTKDVRRA